MRFVSEDAVASAVGALPSPRVVASGNLSAPLQVLAAIAAARTGWQLNMLNAPLGIPTGPDIRLETSFVGPGMRDQPNLDYLPARLSLVPTLFRGGRPPDVVVVHTSTPRDGKVSLGCEVNILPAAIEAARARGGLVVAQVNPHMPYTYGDGELDVDHVDFAVEVDQPLTSPAPREVDDVSHAIAGRVAALVVDGATLQLGIGAVPDATLDALGSRRGLRIWSEMISDGVLALDRSGQLDPDELLTASFCVGSADLYHWIDRNPRLRMRRTETTNDPSNIARQRSMTSINTAMQVDLFAQANASYRRGRVYSGFGGQTDFIVGALHAPGGIAILALRSWHAATGTSTIVPRLAEPATSFQPSSVVSEWGQARIWGSTQSDQLTGLVEQVAHPDAREDLRAAAADF